MTRKEAIERLTDFEELCGCVEEDNEAVQMAIKALEIIDKYKGEIEPQERRVRKNEPVSY